MADFDVVITISFKGKTKAEIKTTLENKTLHDAWVESKEATSNIQFQLIRHSTTMMNSTEQETLE